MGQLNVQKGNAAIDAKDMRGWLVGHFVPEEFGLRHSDDVEIKWGVHKAGEARTEWVTDETRTAICILISGKFEAELRERTIVIDTPGDYLMWGKGVDHRWRVSEDTVTFTIRWPSVPVS
jgi:uncharacterized cupin superfamily protein